MPSRTLLLYETQQALKDAQARITQLESMLSQHPPGGAPVPNYPFFDTLLEGCQVIGFDWTYLYVNNAASRFGRQPKEALIGSNMLTRYPGIENTELFATLRRCMETRIPQQAKYKFDYPDGDEAWFEFSIQPVPEGIFILTLDITQHIQSEDRIRKLYRLYAFLSDVNQSIVRIRNIATLFEMVCDIAVRIGGFRLVWVGMIDPFTQHLTLQAHAGAAEDYVFGLMHTFEDTTQLQTLVDGLRETQTHFIVNDLQADPSLSPLAHEDTVRLGYGSIALLPLFVDGELRGIVTLCAAERHFFDAEEIRLMNEMAGDISFALAFVEQDAQRRQALDDLKRYGQRMELFHKIDQALIQGGSLQQLFATALKNLRELIPCQRAIVALRTGNGDQMRLFAVDLAQDEIEMPDSPFVAPDHPFPQFETNHVIRIPDLRLLLTLDSRLQQLVEQGMVSLLLAQLADEGEVVGMLALGANSAAFFTQEHATIANEVAHQLAVTLRQARMTDELKRYREQLEERVAQRTSELRIAQTQVESILNNSINAILLLDSDLHIRRTNATFQKLYACEARDYAGQPLRLLVTEDDQQRLVQLAEAVLADQQPRLDDFRAVRPDGMLFEALIGLGYLSVDETLHQGLVCSIQDITERKRSEWVVRDSEEKFRMLVDAAPIATVITNPRGEITLVNVRAENLFGYTRDELIGKLVDVLVPMGVRGRHEGHRFDYIAAPRIRQMGSGLELYACRKDGSEFPVEVELSYIETPTGFLVMSFIVDITERKERERQLRFHASLQENVTDAVIATDLDFHIQSWNKAAEAIYGWRADEVIGKLPVDILRTTFPKGETTGGVRNQFMTEGFWTGEVIQYHKDGHPIHILGSTVLFKDDKGHPVGIVSVNRDISERRRSEDLLREQHMFLEQVINSVPGLIIVKDREGQFQLVNNLTAQLFGLTPAEMIGKRDWDVNPNAREVEFFVQKDREAMDLQQPIFVPEERLQDRYYQTSKIPLINHQGVYDRLLIVASDITEHKHAEEALQLAIEKERELGELKSRLVSMASHEFRTPLATILALTETLTIYRQRMDDGQIDDRLVRIREQVAHLKSIVEDVLQLSRLQARRAEYSPTLLDLDALCRSVMDEFMSHPTFAHEIRYSCDPSLRRVRLDRKLMRQIISNLVSNAVKYSNGGQVIFISLKDVDGNLIFDVRDNGIGIPEADMKYIFQPFHRASNVGTISGTGLGLVIVKESVELHGGHIEVESSVGEGTLFRVVIPHLTETEDGHGENPRH
jgi:PAS domain S-box-containing protein